ncbi:heterokaryon incompatibility protein [Colletotrichum salicis]|uniref:Heterokaryon incompatibility protein n=1 Tax=Colletotrichum salicis TaxID=1209931 RepID=A0A135V5D9_9PEZI|nr:heterokaryon incompatibility protein [Colletotrichum salicis]
MDLSSIPLYSHVQLSKQNEIRLVSILPGSASDVLRTQLTHICLKDSGKRRSRKLSIEQLRITLPPKWVARETLDGHVMFRMSGLGNRWQRSHPDENIERWRYESDESDHEVSKSSTSGDRINYEALSYTWGSEQHQQWLLIEDANEMPDDNTSKQRKILIRNNLATAMQHLRLPDRPKRLWIDAICINQQDNVEKDHQFASGHSQAHFNHTEPNILNILGVLAATVTEVRPSFENSSLSPADLLSSWRTAQVQPGKTAIDESGVDHAITLRMNLFKDRYPKLQKTTLQQWLSDTSSFGVLDGVPTGSAVETNTEFQRYFGRTIQMCAGRAYIHTREALPGIAPLDTRTGSSGQYTLIGECFVYGLSDANALLGPLPDSWNVQAFPGFGRRLDFRFLNQATGELVLDDPRLPTLCGWERIYHEPEADDPEIYAFFRNTVSSSEITSDPRMAPAALMDRGVNLRYFAIS